MGYFDERIELPKGQVTEEMLDDIKKAIKNCDEYIKSSGWKGVIAVTGPESLQDIIQEHGRVTGCTKAFYNTKSCFGELDGYKIYLNISLLGSTQVVVNALANQEKTFSMSAK